MGPSAVPDTRGLDLLRVFAAAASAVLLVLQGPPLDLALLGWIALLPLMWALRADSPWVNRVALLVFGLWTELGLFRWLPGLVAAHQGSLGWGWVLTVGLAFVAGLRHYAVFLTVHPLRARFGSGWVLALPSLFVVVEALWVACMPFAWTLGASLATSVPLVQLTSVTGVWGLSWLLVFYAALFGELIYQVREGRPMPVWPAAIGLGALGLVMVSGGLRYAWLTSGPAPRTVTLAQLGPLGVDRLGVRLEGHEAVHSLATPSQGTLPAEVDLVVWPAGDLRVAMNRSAAIDCAWELAEDSGATVLVPAPATVGLGDEVGLMPSVFVFDEAARRVPDGVPSPAEAWQDLLDTRCDLDVAQADTLVEVSMLVQEAHRHPGHEACADRLEARARQLRDRSRVLPPLEARMVASAGLWAALRSELVHFEADPVELDLSSHHGTWLWTLQDGACEGQDCRRVVVGCPAEGDCEVYPNPARVELSTLVPVRDYAPLASLVPSLRGFLEPAGRWMRGRSATRVAHGDLGVELVTGYDLQRPGLGRRGRPADVVVALTQDPNASDPLPLRLHERLATLRAVEMGVPVVRTTSTGRTVVAMPDGTSRHDTAGPDHAAVVTVDILRTATVYGALGNWFVTACAALLAILWLAVRPQDLPRALPRASASLATSTE